jgi:hypothetical protein
MIQILIECSEASEWCTAEALRRYLQRDEVALGNIPVLVDAPLE